MNEDDNKENSSNEEEIPLEEDGPPLTPKSKLKEFFRPLPVKILFSFLLLLCIVWLGFSMCSSPMPLIFNKKHIIALDPTWYPLNLMNKQPNMTAFCETLLHRIATDEKLNIEIYRVPARDLFPNLASERYDGIVTSRVPPPIEIDHYLFSDPIYRLGQVLILKASNPATSLEEMNGKVIGLVGEARETVAIDKFPQIIFNGYLSSAQGFADLDNNKIDGLIMNVMHARIYTQGLFSGRFRLVNTPLTDEAILLIFRKEMGSERFIELFNQGLKKLRDDGQYKSLLKEWQLLKD